MIKNILTRRKESDTYLATVSRPLESVGNDENRCFQPALWPSSAEEED